jgi:hypothetical protein
VPTLREEFLSGDSGRVYRATWEVIHSRDRAVLDPLARSLAVIRAATDGLEMGGALHSNRVSLDHALEKLARVRDGGCWCADYPGLLLYDPEKEEAAGHVRIVSTSEPGWSMTFVCACTVCGREFDIQQGDYHYMWWKWVPRKGV